MSTFNGIVAEFPHIRIDYFRFESRNAPLACFLSHIHSDHIQGLENLTSPPFIYCSAATKELLIRLEKYPDRINHANGILETTKPTYRNLERQRNGRLKPLPLNTPCHIELSPNYSIQVTLLDANHCPGSVMFLIEGQGKAILYTGDVRCEPWFVNALTQNPCMLVYSSRIETLDKIYLDTSFTDDIAFPTQAEGCQELIRKLAPRFKEDSKEIIYHFQAWTWGYEKVWVALAKALRTKIHIDPYRLRLLSSLRARDPERPFDRDVHLTPEAPSLVGFMCGNHDQKGCLTGETDDVRVHSCEKGNYCNAVRRAAADGNVVWIQPVIAHIPSGTGDLVEAGIGGGGDIDEQIAELDCSNASEAEELVRFVTAYKEVLQDGDEEGYEKLLKTYGIVTDAESKGFVYLLKAVLKAMRARTGTQPTGAERRPRKITFPFSRHSSLPELQHLVQAFRPRDVWPCTESPTEWLKTGKSVQSLFGEHCSTDVFEYDRTQLAVAAEWQKQCQAEEDRVAAKSQATTTISESITVQSLPNDCTVVIQEEVTTAVHETEYVEASSPTSHGTVRHDSPSPSRQTPPQVKRKFPEYDEDEDVTIDHDSLYRDSQDSMVSCVGLENRRAGFDAAVGNASGHAWQPINLMSTMDNHGTPEIDLGQRFQ